MSRARRRRKRSAAKLTRRRTLLLTLVIALGGVLVVGSLVEIHGQSSGIRKYTDAGYGALATRVADASNQTGTQLAALMEKAPQLPNGFVSQYTAIPLPARVVLQQGLDQAATATSDQAARAARLVPPASTGTTSERFSEVMEDRAVAIADLRRGIDRLLGMTPLPIAGAPTSAPPASPTPSLSVEQGSSVLAAAGELLQRADQTYGALIAGSHRDGDPVHLPSSVWVPTPAVTAPLGANQLAATAPVLEASPTLNPFHQLIVSAVGLSPPAISAGGLGIIAMSCRKQTSTVPGAAPTVLPPTTTVTAVVTVTNCGTVTESRFVVHQTLSLSDAPGTALPPAADRGATSLAVVTLRSGSSSALPLDPLPVAGGHRYLLTVAITEAGSPAGSIQEFLIQIAE